LVAEIFIKSRLTNNKVLAILRTYNYHSISTGYLYLKDGDTPSYITNFNILHDLEISEIQILNHQGRWVATRNVQPGQSYDIKLIGLGLDTTPLAFDGAKLLAYDSLIGSDQTAYYRISVPMDIKKKEIHIVAKGLQQSQSLSVQEYSKPAALSFVRLNYGDGNQPITTLARRTLYDHVLNDVRVVFDTDQIDQPQNMHRIQHIDIQVELRTAKTNCWI
jgi:hypothetical protein